MAYSNSPEPTSPQQRGTRRAALKGALGGSLRAGSSAKSPSKPRAKAAFEAVQDAVNTLIQSTGNAPIMSKRAASGPDQAASPKSVPPKSAPPKLPSPGAIPEDRALAFAELPLSLEASDLVKEIKVLLDEGFTIDTIYDDLLAPAARWLGEKWEQDACDFVDVTMGLWRLHEVMRVIASDVSPAIQADGPAEKRAVFIPMPGDQHFMGPQMLEDVFTRAGWDACSLAEPRRGDILGLLGKESFDLVGLTLSRDCPSASARNLISAMRLASRNPEISVLVGGRMINQNPAVVAEVGADGTGADARTALVVAERLVKSPEVRAHLIR